MKLREVTIHNVRSVKDVTLNLSGYSMLVGENNVGKTNILTAIRLFYEDGGVKYKHDTDFPKFDTDDKESWVEFAFETDQDEQDSLKREYQSVDRVLRVRKYFESENPDLVKTNQSNIYGYEAGELSKNLFYGAKNVSQAKIGKTIFIPAVSKTDDTLKLTGPSPFREMVNFVMKRAVMESQTFDVLKTAFDTFNTDFKDEVSKDGFSINALIEDINLDIQNWNVRFGVNLNPIQPEDIVKNLLSHYVEDIGLGGQQINLSSFGQGLQRHLIYTLIKLSAKYVVPSKAKKNDFDPDFTLLLFEEPEAFLHPSQQQSLHLNLRKLTTQASEQVLISSHSPHFVSKQISEMEGIVRVQKNNGITSSYQVTKEIFENILDENVGLYKKFCDCLIDPSIDVSVKNRIKKDKLGDDPPDEFSKLEEEALKYFLWLDSERSAMFFAKRVIICEGASEKIFLDYLIDELWPEKRDDHLCFIDALGKYNIHRYMSLLTALAIPHSVLMDGDENGGVHDICNEFIQSKTTPFTHGVHIFKKDFEDFLGISKPNRNDLKPLNVIVKYKNNEIPKTKLEELKVVIDTL